MTYFPLFNIAHRRLFVCFTFPLLLTLPVNTSQNMDTKALSAAVAKFSAKFCNELPNDKSVVSSPLSAEFVLALLTLGSTNEVQSELLNSLDFPDIDMIRLSFTAVSSTLKSIKGVTLNVANKVYIMDGEYKLNPQLQDDAVKVFDAELDKLDFSNGPASAAVINKWVESKTNNRIKDLLSGDSLNSMTKLVLVNALYFKGTWEKQFEKRMTAERPFHIDDTNSIKVEMMYKEDQFRYGESEALNAQLLEMEYVGGQASMVIVLPKEITGLATVLQKLADGHDLMKDIENMYKTKVQVHVPKFKIETKIDLKELLPKLGITSIFDPHNTGLNKILTNELPLYVSTAVQKAFIEVNEEGAEAAAATGMVMMMRCARPPSPLFLADRPFLYMLTGPGRVPTFIGLYRGNAQ